MAIKMYPKSFLNKQTKEYLPLFSVILLGLASLFLYQPVLIWFSQKISLTNGYLHLFAMLGVFGLAAYRMTQQDKLEIHPPVFFHPALFIWIPATILYLLSEVSIGFHTLSATLFIVYVYGLSGHFLSKRQWKVMLLPTLLLILVLPFEHYLDIYLGFPLRLLSAEWAASVLQFSSATTATVESILIIDNKVAIVDLDCSGINSLWIGLIFYLLLTWIEKYRITWRWLIVAVAFIFLLIVANVFRIVILVLLDLVFDLPQLAMMFHQSLGLLGFIIASLITWTLLHYFVEKHKPISANNTNDSYTTKHPILNTTAFLLIIFMASAFYQPFEKKNTGIIHHTLNLDPKYQAKEVALSAIETDFFSHNGSQAKKYSLTVNNQKQVLNASMVLVWSKQWRSQHIPENCYLSQGYSIQKKGLWNISSTLGEPQHSLRYLTLNKKVVSKPSNHQKIKKFTGIYWFQSKNKITPNFSSRVLDDLFHPNKEWVMVSILWDRAVNPDIISTFVTQLKNELNHED